MIISCPQCFSEFVLDVDKLPPAKFLQDHGYGWVMACSDCKHRWWHKSAEKPEVPAFSPTEMSIPPISDDFEDLTNLDGLKRIITRVPTPAEDVLARSAFYQSAPRDDYYQPSNNQEPILDLEGRRLKPEHRPSKPRFSKALFSFWLLFLFLTGILFGGFFIYKDRIINRVWNQSTKSVKKSSANVTPLVLQNVKYVSQSAGGGRNYLNVMGEIVNNNSTAIALHPIRIVVWSHCPAANTNPGAPNAAPSSAEALVNCIKADWSHTWERLHILPGERLWFQTGTPLAADIKVERVDVTLP
ncbi:MAG: zinc-ribbon domain-containing protein [Alphaproteobacteria bacterium]|nr:zinc-ribbon domain-containing protein [Alphaproteobacteria bacterium]